MYHIRINEKEFKTFIVEENFSIGIPYDVTGESLIEMLESGIPEMGNVYAYRHGDCASFDLSVAFLTKAGDQEEMQLTSQLSGVDVMLNISTVVDGGITFDPIHGDMLMTYHDKPQVMAYINDIPTKCSGVCTFEWTMAATMTVTSVNPTTGRSTMNFFFLHRATIVF